MQWFIWWYIDKYQQLLRLAFLLFCCLTNFIDHLLIGDKPTTTIFALGAFRCFFFGWSVIEKKKKGAKSKKAKFFSFFKIFYCLLSDKQLVAYDLKYVFWSLIIRKSFFCLFYNPSHSNSSVKKKKSGFFFFYNLKNWQFFFVLIFFILQQKKKALLLLCDWQ